MQVIALKSPIIESQTDLFEVLLKIIAKQKVVVEEGDILVISSKVVALSEDRIVKLSEVEITKKAKELPPAKYCSDLKQNSNAFKQLVLDEADVFLGGDNVYLTIKNQILIPNSGIDLSNVPAGYAILWPEDSFYSAQKIRQKLQKKFSLKKIGVVVIDSHCQPMRTGVTGIALGWDGIQGVEDIRGQKDLFENELNVTQKNVADQLAATASVLMGEADERIPFVLIKNAPVKFNNQKFNSDSYAFALEDDLFAGVYSSALLNNTNS